MSYSSSLEFNEQREETDYSNGYKGTESYGLTKEQYNWIVNLFQTQGSNTNQNASSCKVNLKTHVNNHIASCIFRVSYSLSHYKIGSWIVDYGASHQICSSLRFFIQIIKIH